jgi:hypothetical protein
VGKAHKLQGEGAYCCVCDQALKRSATQSTVSWGRQAYRAVPGKGEQGALCRAGAKVCCLHIESPARRSATQLSFSWGRPSAEPVIPALWRG